MLGAIVAAIRAAGRPVCLADLSEHVGVDESALEGMLDTLVARGRLRRIAFDGTACTACPIKSGCFLIDDGVAVTWALPMGSGVVVPAAVPVAAVPVGAVPEVGR